MEVTEGRSLALTKDFLAGADRTAQAIGLPGARVVQKGDPIICDLGPRAAGYWGDSCNTLCIGDPAPRFMKMYEAVRRAIERVAEILRPGITASHVDAEARSTVRRAGFDYHHSGHGIGTAVHEYPLIGPEETVLLEPDMVLMVEPGACVPGLGGVRLAWMFRLIPAGNQVLSSYEHVLRAGRA